MASLPNLIETHTAAVACRAKATRVLMAPGIASLEDLDAYDRATDAETAAARELIAFPVSDMSEAATKAAYLLGAADRIAFEPRHVKALLQSLIPAL